MVSGAGSNSTKGAAPALLGLARALTGQEAAIESCGLSGRMDVLRVYTKLCRHLAPFLGLVGVRALATRALWLARCRYSSLEAASIRDNLTLSGLSESDAEEELEQAHAASLEVVAQMLGLLVCFIGEALTLQLVREVWPQVPLAGVSLELRQT